MTESEWLMGNSVDSVQMSRFVDGVPFDGSPYIRLLFNDLLNAAIAEANGRPQSTSGMEARQFLLEDREWFQVVCAGAGLKSTALREHLRNVLRDKNSTATGSSIRNEPT